MHLGSSAWLFNPTALHYMWLEQTSVSKIVRMWAELYLRVLSDPRKKPSTTNFSLASLSVSLVLPVFIMFLISVLCSSASIYAHIQCFYTMNGYTQFQTVHPPQEEGGVVELLPAGHYRACRDRPRPKRTSLLNIYTSMCTSGLDCLCARLFAGDVTHRAQTCVT